jgi:alanine-glyoxylate transaminase/serine-glyoxylate transaminase/serine-pyruvate transaminase
MLPPGLAFNGVGAKALTAAKTAGLPKSYWDWQAMLSANAKGVFPYTPATNLLYGLRESLNMLQEEGLERVFARHDRHAEATRRAVRTWGLELLGREPREYSSSLTAVLVPASVDADALRATILERYDLSLGNGLGRLAGRVFRIGHLGDFNDLMLAGTLAGIEMGLDQVGFARAASGVAAALAYLAAPDAAAVERASAA